MFYEKLNFKFDIDKIQKDVINNIFPLGEKVIQGEEFETPQYNGFGGWSLLSRTGDWRDGFAFFQNGEDETLESIFSNQKDTYKALKYFDIAHSLEYKVPTEAYQGYLKEVLETLEFSGFYPRRARITCLKAGSKSLVHTDGNPDNYIARIHIPIFTNPKCVHICDGINLHMPADGSAYMMWVNTWHQIRNDSSEDRYHLIMDAYDTKYITKGIKYQGNIKILEEEAELFRKNVDAAVLTQTDIDRFEALKQKYKTK